MDILVIGMIKFIYINSSSTSYLHHNYKQNIITICNHFCRDWVLMPLWIVVILSYSASGIRVICPIVMLLTLFFTSFSLLDSPGNKLQGEVKSITLTACKPVDSMQENTNCMKPLRQDDGNSICEKLKSVQGNVTFIPLSNVFCVSFISYKLFKK